MASSLQAAFAQKGMTAMGYTPPDPFSGGASVNLVGTKKNSALSPTGGNTAGTLNKGSTAGTVTGQEARSDMKEKFNREFNARQAQQLVGNQMAQSKMWDDRNFNNAQLELARKTQADDNRARTKQAGMDRHASAVGLHWQGYGAQTEREKVKSNEKISMQGYQSQDFATMAGLQSNLASTAGTLKANLANTAATRDSTQKQFESTNRKTDVDRQRVAAEERVGTKQAEFGLFTNLMNSFATNRRDPFGYLNAV
jgi:hypothetical protein